MKQAELQAEQQKFQAETQLEMQRIQMQAQAKQAEQMAALQVQQANDERDAAREQARAEMDAQLKQLEADNKSQLEAQKLELERWKAQLQSNTQIYIEQVKAGQLDASEAVELAAPGGAPATDLRSAMVAHQATIAETLASLRLAIDAMRAPRQIVRDANGRAQGIV
jgi:hypothetical protein